jgi:hypothetical protein
MYLVLKSCRAQGKSLSAGEVVDLPQEIAKTLIEIGRVEKTDAKPEVEVEEVKEERVVKPKRTRKAKK